MAQNRVSLALNFKLQHFSVRQLAGPDRSGNFPHRIDLKHKTIGDGGPPSCDRGQRQRWLVLISSSCWKLWRPPCDRGRFGLGQGCIFRAPIMSWPRIMCSQVRMLKFLQQPREIPYIRVSEGKKTVLSFPETNMQWIYLFKHEQRARFSENQSTPKLENRKTTPCSARAPNLLHMLPSQMVGWNELCNPAAIRRWTLPPFKGSFPLIMVFIFIFHLYEKKTKKGLK